MQGKLLVERGGHGLLRPAQRLLDAAHGADVHGRSRAAHRLRERGEPAHRACLRAAAGDRRQAVARRVARPPRAAAARRESGAVVRRCRDGGVPVRRADAESVVARPVRLFAHSDQRQAGSADSRLHADPHVAHRRDLRPRARAAREPRRSLGDAQGHGRIHHRWKRIALPSQRTRDGAGRAQLPAAVRRRPVRPEPAESAEDRHRRRSRQPGRVPALAGAERLRHASRDGALSAAAGAAALVTGREVRRIRRRPDPLRRRVGQQHVGRGSPSGRRRGHAGVHECALARLLRDDADSDSGGA